MNESHRKTFANFVNFASGKSFSYCDPKEKNLFLSRGVRVMKAISELLGVQASVRKNKGGIAVSGEVYFDSPELYGWVEVSCLHSEAGFIFRKGRNGNNIRIPLSTLKSPEYFLDVLDNIRRGNRIIA